MCHQNGSGLFLPFSFDQQSQPSRAAAASALSHISPFLFPRTPNSTSASAVPISPSSLLSCQQAILALLQDDDEEIRLQVADVVRIRLGARRPVCQTTALDMWWKWCETYMAGFGEVERKPWISWMASLAKDDPGYGTSRQFSETYLGRLRADHGQRRTASPYKPPPPTPRRRSCSSKRSRTSSGTRSSMPETPQVSSCRRLTARAPIRPIHCWQAPQQARSTRHSLRNICELGVIVYGPVPRMSVAPLNMTCTLVATAYECRSIISSITVIGAGRRHRAAQDAYSCPMVAPRHQLMKLII